MRQIAINITTITIVDDEDYDYLFQFTWYLSEGYAIRTTIDRQIVFMHHNVVGKAPAGFVVDHKDRDKLNNTRENLRFVTQSVNCQNKNCQVGKSGYRGVFKSKKRWYAQIKVNQQPIYLGSKKDIVEAAKLYDQAALKHFGPNALTNFPQ